MAKCDCVIEPEIVLIPQGFFNMGCEAGQDNEKPIHRVWIDEFGLGRYPVTNREYRVFIDDMSNPEPPFWREPSFADSNKPVVGVTWHEAVAYCAWLSARCGRSYRLPTEAEWERAARGNRDGALYPWGDTLPLKRPYAGFDVLHEGPAIVGANEPNDFGLFDMSEGVHEWCSDYYDYNYYAVSPERNPQGATNGTRRASRGGSWRHHVKFSRCAARSSLPPDFRYADYGFRVALTVR